VRQLVLTDDLDAQDSVDDDFENWETKSPKEVRQRAVVLFGIVHTSHEANGPQTRKWLEDQNLSSAISPDENRMLQSNVLTDKDRIDASWQVEGLEALLWALGELPDLSPPSALCDVERVQQVFSFFMADSADFVNKERMRPEDEIYEQREAILEHHWKIRDAHLHKKPVPADLNRGVIQEKHYALNWILDGDDWDEVQTDT